MTKERERLQRRYTELNAKCIEIEHKRATGQIPADKWVFYRNYYDILSLRRMQALSNLQRLGPISEQHIATGFPQTGHQLALGI